MNVASLELCKELYELSGWIADEYVHVIAAVGYPPDGKAEWMKNILHKNSVILKKANIKQQCPAYDLGYLLRKLPPRIVLSQRSGNSWDADCYCGVVDGKKVKDTSVYKHADSPEDAACKLAIELFKQGVMKKEAV